MIVRFLQALMGVSLAGGGGYLAWLNRAQAFRLFPPDPHAPLWELLLGLVIGFAGLVLVAQSLAPRTAEKTRQAAEAQRRRAAIQAADAYYAERARAADRDWRSGDLPKPADALAPQAAGTPAPLSLNVRSNDDLPAASAPLKAVIAPSPAPGDGRLLAAATTPAAPAAPTALNPSAAAPPPSSPQPARPALSASSPRTSPPGHAPIAGPVAAAIKRPSNPAPVAPPALASAAATGPSSSVGTATSTHEPIRLSRPENALSFPAPVPAKPIPRGTEGYHPPTPVALTGRDAAVGAQIANNRDTNASTLDPFAGIRAAINDNRLDEADRLLAAERIRLTSAGDSAAPELAELTGLAGDHAAAGGRMSGAKWLWRLALQRFGQANAMASPAARAISERLRLADQ